MVDLTGKIAIVTGSSKGIGAELAFRLAEAGAAVVVNYASDREGAERVVARIEAAGGRAIAARADVSSETDVRRLIERTMEEFGAIDIIVNNAAFFTIRPIEQLTVEEFHRHFNTNVLGAMLMVREASPHLKAGASIVNIGSAGTRRPLSNGVLYASSKAALERFTDFLAKELGPRQIRVNMVLPGVTYTEGNRALGSFDNEAAIASLSSQAALGRIAEPADIAPSVLFLASDDAAWVTGAFLDASGGFR